MPATPPPTTRAFFLTGTLGFSWGVMSLALATDILTRSLAFSVAFSGSLMWTQEQCSLILAMSTR